MALTELRAAQLLAKRHVGRIPPDDWNNLPALCGHLDEVTSLRIAFSKGSTRRELRDPSELAVVVRDALDDASITEPGAQLVAVEAVLRTLSQVFNLNVSTHNSFRDLCRDVVERARAVVPRPHPAKRPKRGVVGARVAAVSSLSEDAPTGAATPNPPNTASIPREELREDVTTELPPPSHSLLKLQAELILARAAPALEAAIAAFRQCEAARQHWGVSPADRDLSENLRSALESIQDVAHRAKEALPSADELLTQARERDEVASVLNVSADAALAADAYQLLRDQRDWPAIVKAIALMKSLDSAGLPGWLWPNSLPDELRGSSIGRVVALRRDPVLCDDFSRCVEWVSKLPFNEHHQLAHLSEASANGTLVQRLDGAWTRAEHVRAVRAAITARLAHLSDVFQPAILDAIVGRDDEPELLLARAEDYRNRLIELGEHLHPAVRKQLVDVIQRLESDTAEVLTNLQFVRDQLGTQVLQGMSSLESLNALATSLADKFTSLATPSVSRTITSRPGTPSKIKIDHPLSRQIGQSTNTYQATVCYRRRAQDPYGIVTVPVRLSIDPQLSEPCEVALSVDGELLADQPKEWKQVIEPRSVSVPAGVSRLDLGVSIPLTTQRASSVQSKAKMLSLRFSVKGEQLDSQSDHALSWRELVIQLPQLRNPFPNSMQLEVMEQRPLGVEKHFETLYQLVRQGDRSFIVRAPRRYGKTWLLEGVITKSRNTLKDVFVVEDVVASSRDLAGVWNLLAERLEKEFSRPVQKEIEDGVILREEALDQVREEAHRRGIKSIYLLIDEAQSFFSHPQSRRLSERLKERLEGAWGSREKSRAAIRMGFVGQAHLTKLMGGNLLGAIPAHYDNQPITEEDLLGLLRDAAAEGGLQSTSEARRRLVELAGNLWILDKLVDGVIQQCMQKSRPWFLNEDVDAAAEALVEAYRTKKDDTLWRYVRDVLNESDDLDKWVPSETFPVAMALARAREDQLGATELPTRVEEILRSWARNLEILPDRIAQALERMRDANVINREHEFEIPILERLLAVRAREEDPFEDEAEKEALDRLGLSRIRRPQPPAGPDETHGGGQATIYRGTCEGQDVAVRCIRLSGQVARRRFMSELNALERLTEVNPTSTSDWTDVYSHVPRMVRSGIADDDPTYGVVMYQWIHGHHLRERSLSEDALLTVGRSMSAVLQLLNELEIVHRDIHPKNIILRSPRWSPVLIDFGLARAVIELASNPDTFAGLPDFIPPEVVAGGSQRWSTAGDVFSLGQTLLRCAKTSVATPKLSRLLTAMTGSNASGRPSAKEVQEEFRALEDASKVDMRRKQVEARVSEHISKLPESIRPVAERAKADTCACLIGLVGDSEQRAAIVAEFLENVFSKYVGERRDLRDAFQKEQGTKLRWVGKILDRVNDRELRPLAASCAVAVAHLRNANAHSTEFEKHLGYAYRELRATRAITDGRPNDRVLMNALIDTAGRLGSLLHARDPLKNYLQFWLGLAP